MARSGNDPGFLAGCRAGLRVALAVPKPVEWLLLLALLAFSYHYFWLMDDAFIYFRYVDNLLFLGRGLVFNQGEFVEGYSSPAWLLLLIPLRATHIDYWALVRALSLVFAGVYGASLVVINRRLTPAGPVVNFPLAASAAHYGITSHFSSGLETPAVQTMAAAFAALTLQPDSRWLQIVVAAAPLVRPELMLAAALWVSWYAIARRRLPYTLIVAGVLINGAWLVFRVRYYADFLPNTFYLKDATNWLQGYYYLENVLEAHHWPAVLLGLASLAVLSRVLHQKLTVPAGCLPWPRTCMVAMAGAYLVYVARIGGDMLYHRYASFSVCLGLCASSGIVETALSALTVVRARGRALIAAAVSVATAVGFAAGYPAQLLSHPITLDSRTRHYHAISDPMWHRKQRALRADASRSTNDAALRRSYAAASPRQRMHDSVLVTGWCRKAYFVFNQYVVHDLALTEPILARLPAARGRPGHKLVKNQAVQLAAFRRHDGIRRERGAIARWLEMKDAPKWVRRNRAALLVIEQKAYNRHRFWENLTLARTRIELR